MSHSKQPLVISSWMLITASVSSREIRPPFFLGSGVQQKAFTSGACSQPELQRNSRTENPPSFLLVESEASGCVCGELEDAPRVWKANEAEGNQPPFRYLVGGRGSIFSFLDAHFPLFQRTKCVLKLPKWSFFMHG